MHHFRNSILLVSILVMVLTSCGSAQSTQRTSGTPTPTQAITPEEQSTATQQITPTPPPRAKLRHIFYIMMENHSTNQILGNTADAPYLNSLANNDGEATHYYGVTHPSLPNYLAAIAGDFQGIWDDCPAGAAITCSPEEFVSSLTQNQIASASSRPHMFNGQTIIDQLEVHHMTWKAYMQSMPFTGFTGASYGLYAQKHNPFMYFTAIRNNPARMQHIVPLIQFDQDLQSNNVPNFVWISPDACNDMHGAPGCTSFDGLIALGDNFARTIVQKIMHSSAWKEGSAIVIVWDENYTGLTGCCKSPTGVNGVILGGADVPVIVVSSQIAHHIVLNTTSYNHYSLLATIEQIWNLGCLANTCGFSTTSLMTRLFA